MLRDELKKRQLDEKKYMDPDTYKTYLGSFGARSFDDILYFIGKKFTGDESAGSSCT